MGPPPPHCRVHDRRGCHGGAILGAGLGAIIGAATGKAGQGAVIGAIAGAAAGAAGGFAYAKHQEKWYGTARRPRPCINYQPEQGERVIMEGVEVSPTTVTKGDEVALNSNFTVLNRLRPTGDPVEVTQTISSEGKPVDQPSMEKSQPEKRQLWSFLLHQDPGEGPGRQICRGNQDTNAQHHGRKNV